MLPCWLTWDLFGWFSISTFDLSSCFCAAAAALSIAAQCTAAAFVPTTGAAAVGSILFHRCALDSWPACQAFSRNNLDFPQLELMFSSTYIQVVSFQGSIPASNLAIWENFLQIWARYVRTKASARLMNIKGVPIHRRYGSVMPMENGPFAFSSDQVYNH